MASDPAMAVTDAARSERKDPIASVAGQIAKLSTGDRARLRRMYLTQSHEADGVVLGLVHRAGMELGEASTAFERWRLLAHVAALLAGTGGLQSHAPGRRVGRALYDAGYSENRLLRLTAARGPALEGQIIRVARMLAQAGAGPINLWTLFNLAGRGPERAKAAEEARIQIARDYYAAAAREGDPK